MIVLDFYCIGVAFLDHYKMKHVFQRIFDLLHENDSMKFRSAISKNWEGVPLRTYETIVNYIRTTKNSKGLRVEAVLVDKKYETGRKLRNELWKSLPIIKFSEEPYFSCSIRRRTSSKSNLSSGGK